MPSSLAPNSYIKYNTIQLSLMCVYVVKNVFAADALRAKYKIDIANSKTAAQCVFVYLHLSNNNFFIAAAAPPPNPKQNPPAEKNNVSGSNKVLHYAVCGVAWVSTKKLTSSKTLPRFAVIKRHGTVSSKLILGRVFVDCNEQIIRSIAFGGSLRLCLCLQLNWASATNLLF